MKKIYVKDVRNKITKPLIISEDNLIEKIADKFLESPINRTIYVVNDDEKYSGYIKLTNFLEFILVDMVDTSFYKNLIDDPYSLGKLFTIKRAKDLMRTENICVKDDDNLEKVVTIMNNYSLQELPVIDNENRIIGDINIHEIILGWKMRRS
jgi:Mg/Co/Ni transporter MgtE